MWLPWRRSVWIAPTPTWGGRGGVPRPLNVGAIGGGWRVHLVAHFLDVVEGRVAGTDLTAEHLLVGFAEVFRQESVDDGVDGRVAVRQAVGGDPQHEGGLVEREGPELDPQVNHVVRQPGEAEDHHHHQDRLSCLEDTKRERSFNPALFKRRLITVKPVSESNRKNWILTGRNPEQDQVYMRRRRRGDRAERGELYLIKLTAVAEITRLRYDAHRDSEANHQVLPVYKRC